MFWIWLQKKWIKFDGRKCNSNEEWNNEKCQCECKKYKICEINYIRNPTTCSCKKILLITFLLVTIVFLIAVSFYCHLIKYQAKQKDLLPFHVTSNELKEVIF